MATEYIVSGTLVHGGVEYADGTLFSTDDKTLEATLLRHGTLLTLEQYERQAEANNDVAAKARALALHDKLAGASAAKDEELEALRKQLAEAQSANDTLKSGEDGSSTEEPASDGEESKPSEDSADA